MSWLQLDDKFAEDPKVSGLSDGAFRLHVSALTYCARHETDGRLLDHAVLAMVRVEDRLTLADELVKAGLWERIVGGFEIHKYLKWNKSHAQLEAQRVAAKARQQKHRANDVTRDGHAVTNALVTRCKGVAGASSSLLGSVSDLRSDPDLPGQVATARPRSAPPPPMPVVSPEVEAMAAEIARHEVFGGLDATRLARTHEGTWIAKPQKVEWVLQAIADCAAKSEGLGLNSALLQAKLVGFMRNASAPRSTSRIRAAPVQPAARPGEYDWQKAAGVDGKDF